MTPNASRGSRPRTARTGASLAVLLATLLSAAASADALRPPAGPEEFPEPERLSEQGEDVSAAEWRAMAEGRTVWYADRIGMWGRERYGVDGNRVVFQFHTGECLSGDWSHDGLLYCFDFRDGPPHCFRHLRWNGRLWVLGVEGAVQEVVRIDDAPVDCGPAPTS